jgi:uncharacterized protein
MIATRHNGRQCMSAHFFVQELDVPDIVLPFFVLGVIAGLAKSDLKVPKAAYDTLSILLMLTLGLKGGLALHGQVSLALLPEIAVVLGLGVLVPLLLYPLLRHLVKQDAANSASLAAHYGSTSAGTFAVVLAFAEAQSLAFAPQVTLYLVLLEMPALVVAIVLYRRLGSGEGALGPVLHEALTSRGVLLLAGGMLIGYLYGPEASAPVTDVFMGAFKALLALFLLEMGLCVSQHLWPFPWHYGRLVVFAVVIPPLLAGVAIAVGWVMGLGPGTTLVLSALLAGASYIAAPTAVRASIPQADVGRAVFAALAVTFPFNVLVGIPLYHRLIVALPWPA